MQWEKVKRKESDTDENKVWLRYSMRLKKVIGKSLIQVVEVEKVHCKQI